MQGDAPWIHREGVLWHEPSHTDLLFVREPRSRGLLRSSGGADLVRPPVGIRWRLERAIQAGWMQGMGLAV